MEIFIGTDAATGSPMYRELDYFIAGIKEPKITVFYRQWLLSPNGVRYNEQNQRKYYVIDIAAVIRKGDHVLVTPAILDQDGVTEITPAIYKDEPDVIVTPANLQYTGWKEKVITSQMVGAKLGDDIIIGSINATLQGLPTDVIDGHVITG